MPFYVSSLLVMVVVFWKMQALGNDFVLIEEEKGLSIDYPEFARSCLRRRFGIGGDQLLVLSSSNKGDVRMRIFNKDGSEAEMCGNGIRCVGRYVREVKGMYKDEISVETLAGVKKVWFERRGIRVDMGIPVLNPSEIPANFDGEVVINRPLRIKGRWLRVNCISMGNPHCVIFKSVSDYELRAYGPLIENHPSFPQKTNVEFVEVINRNTIDVKVWERGAGATLACGTGACASLVAAVLNELTQREVEVRLPGGSLYVEWGERSHVFMIGPAEFVYRGEIELK